MPDVDNAKGEKSFGKLHVKLFVIRALKPYMYIISSKILNPNEYSIVIYDFNS